MRIRREELRAANKEGRDARGARSIFIVKADDQDAAPYSHRLCRRIAFAQLSCRKPLEDFNHFLIRNLSKIAIITAGYGEGFPVTLLRKWVDKIGF